MRPAVRASLAVASLSAILAVTVAWWALALWPIGSAGPEWVLRTRAVCFGATAERLPDASGWLVLIGQPAGMIGFLFFVWGTDVRSGIRTLTSRVSGQLAVGVTLSLMFAGIGAVAVRVQTAGLEPFDAGGSTSTLTRLDDAAPAMALVDQHGRQMTLDSFRGRPLLVTFAYAHCQTVCPIIVSEVIAARRQLGKDAPPLLVITLDPWRDTTNRLPTIARAWGLDAAEYVVSGHPDDVERTLNGWRVPRARNEKTGDISHPSLVYLLGADGRIHYVVNASAESIAAAVRAL
jgi:protein SCO1/2